MPNKQSANELIDLMMMVSRIIKEKIKVLGVSHQLSTIHLWTLRFVAENGQPTMHDIAEFLSISAPSATSFVETLIKGGYLERRADESDRRVVRIVLTADGEKRYINTIKTVKLKIEELLSPLTGQERKGLESGLKALIKIINK